MLDQTKEESLVVRHVGDIYRNSNNGKGHSWRILNSALFESLSTCITAHLPFQPDDFETIYNQFKGGFWFGADSDGKGAGGRFYSMAAECGNMSACQSFEQWRGFEPYLLLGKRMAVGFEVFWVDHNLDFSEVALIKPPRNDLALLEYLKWKGKRWHVTGIEPERIRLAAYHRRHNMGGHQEGKPTSNQNLTHADLARLSKALRSAAKVKQQEAV